MSEFCKYKIKEWIKINYTIINLVLNRSNQIESILSGGLSRHVYVSSMVLK